MNKPAMLLVALVFCLVGSIEAQAQVPGGSCCQPVVVYRPPVVVVPRTVYYAPASVAYRPVARVRTRYRPFLGGAVTRVRYGYAPAYYAPASVMYAY